MQEKKERFHGIPMLPYGLLSAVMQESPGNRKEIQITEMAEEGFCFRTARLSAAHRNWKFVFMIWRGQNTGL